MADPQETIGSIAESLSMDVHSLTRLAHFICIVMGIILFSMAIAFYKNHKDNPKFMPLDKIILYIVLGLFAFSIPFLGKMIGPTGSSIDYHKHELQKKGVQPRDIDAPLWGDNFEHNDFGH